MKDYRVSTKEIKKCLADLYVYQDFCTPILIGFDNPRVFVGSSNEMYSVRIKPVHGIIGHNVFETLLNIFIQYSNECIRYLNEYTYSIIK